MKPAREPYDADLVDEHERYLEGKIEALEDEVQEQRRMIDILQRQRDFWKALYQDILRNKDVKAVLEKMDTVCIVEEPKE